nr:ankycorbin-like isoform X1 [Procambarus clarkii]XP_045619195.1 ankycorbin-like isoform X1 [Procambarus clarkii]XP_045619196.1 ankycorbin-like isoform X1 [Procambarus clarkii]XP_045619197.1 ankycorbin-like isoform X1 [Procambarus clarkii]XP_045619198.1 ankycorbin-like isoform X1 [Procambarus clarkii]
MRSDPAGQKGTMDEPQKLLMRCAKAGDTAGADVALQRGARVDLLEVQDPSAGGGGRAALHHASAAGHVDVVNLLIDFKANVDIKSKMAGDHGAAALHLAALNGQLDVVKSLVRAGAHLEDRTNQGATPLHLSAGGGHVEVLEHLLRAAADMESADDKGRRAVHWAASRGQQEAMEILKANGANLHSRAHGGATVLHFAAADGDLSFVKWLVAAGIRCDAKDKHNRLAKELAKSRGHHDVHKYLKGHTPSKGGLFQFVRSPLRSSSGRASKRHKNPQLRDGSWERKAHRPDRPHTIDLSPETDVEPEVLARTDVAQAGLERTTLRSSGPESADIRLASNASEPELNSSKMDYRRKLSLDSADFGLKLTAEKTDYGSKQRSEKTFPEPSVSSYKINLSSESPGHVEKAERAPTPPETRQLTSWRSPGSRSLDRDGVHSLPPLSTPLSRQLSTSGSTRERESKRTLSRSFSLTRRSTRKTQLKELTENKGILEDVLRSKELELAGLRDQLTQLEREKVEAEVLARDLQHHQQGQTDYQQHLLVVSRQNEEYQRMIEHLERRQEEFMQVDSAKSDAIAACDSHIRDLTRTVGENREQLSRYQKQHEEREAELLELDAAHKQTIDTLKADVDRLTAMLRKSADRFVGRENGTPENEGEDEEGDGYVREDGIIRSVDHLEKNLNMMSRRVEEFDEIVAGLEEELRLKNMELENIKHEHQQTVAAFWEEVEALKAKQKEQEERVSFYEKSVAALNDKLAEKSTTVKEYKRHISSLQTKYKKQVEELTDKLEEERRERQKERGAGDHEISLLTSQLKKERKQQQQQQEKPPSSMGDAHGP